MRKPKDDFLPVVHDEPYEFRRSGESAAVHADPSTRTVERSGGHGRTGVALTVTASLLVAAGVIAASRQEPAPQKPPAQTSESLPQGPRIVGNTIPEGMVDDESYNRAVIKNWFGEAIIGKDREVAVFLGSVVVSNRYEKSKPLPNPIIFNDSDVFFPGRGRKRGQTERSDFDYKFYGLLTIPSGPQSYPFDPSVATTDDFTSFEFFTPDGTPVALPDMLLPQDPSEFMKHVVWTHDLSVVNGPDHETRLVLPDGTRVAQYVPTGA